jgi:hypothetical protein
VRAIWGSSLREGGARSIKRRDEKNGEQVPLASENKKEATSGIHLRIEDTLEAPYRTRLGSYYEAAHRLPSLSASVASALIACSAVRRADSSSASAFCLSWKALLSLLGAKGTRGASDAW